MAVLYAVLAAAQSAAEARAWDRAPAPAPGLLANDCGAAGDDEVDVVLLHGLAHSSADMDALALRLRKEFPRRRVTSVEVQLGALSTFVGNPRGYVQAAAESIRAAARGRCIDMVGHSQGAFVARAYLQLYSGELGMPGVRDFYSVAGALGGFYCYERCGKFSAGMALRVA